MEDKITMQVQEDLALIKELLGEAENYWHAESIVSYDRETVCPPDALEEKGDLMAFLERKAFEIRKSPAYTEALTRLHLALKEHEESVPEGPDRDMIRLWYRLMTEDEKVTPEMAEHFSKVSGKAFADWLQAREKEDYSLFSDSLSALIDENRRIAVLKGGEDKDPYDTMLDEYERGMDRAQLDEIFGACRERLVPLIEKVGKSKKVIRTDFLSRKVTVPAQKEMSEYLLCLIGFDRRRGTIGEVEHPFTDGFTARDVRITTHYFEDGFCRNISTVMHEGGHALFEQNQPEISYAYFLRPGKTTGMHESVSRFYENRIGRSRAFTDLIYPKTAELFPEAMDGVSPEQFYEGINAAGPSLIRVDADELTYTMHVIIRYEMEKKMIAGQISRDEIPAVWNDLYEKYLGIRPANDREGVLQDVHWTRDFGYFPGYALGNIYNAMYYNRMKEDLDPEAEIRSGDLSRIGNWMKEHVYLKADRQTPKEWIRDITGRDLTPDDFLDYLEEKYGTLYEI